LEGRKETHLKEGDIFESLLDGTEYVVRNIANSMAVLQSTKGNGQILTGLETLKTKQRPLVFYHKISTKWHALKRVL
jgi:hypothetical protein